MIVLAIDPGTIVSGYGVVSLQKGCYQAIDYGCIRPPKKYEISERYLVIFNGVEELLDRHRPDVVVVETQYFNTDKKKQNVQSIIKLGMARGAVIIAAARKKIQIVEYAPTRAKKAVVGTGRASKLQVQAMVQRLLNLKEMPPEDAADALALALCHIQNNNLPYANYEKKIERG